MYEAIVKEAIGLNPVKDPTGIFNCAIVYAKYCLAKKRFCYDTQPEFVVPQ